MIEGTRSAPDKHGVYQANVMIEGVKKGPRSTFFPKNWSQEQVETAIREAAENAKPKPRYPSTYRGTTSGGMEIEFELKDGAPQTVYPLYKGEP